MDDDPTSDFGSIITGVNDNVDAIVSGHTHLAYNCSLPGAPGGRGPSGDRASGGLGGPVRHDLNQLVFTVDPATGEVRRPRRQARAAAQGAPTPAVTFNYPVDPATQAIVDARRGERRRSLGAQPLGKIGGPFNRAKFANGTTENRGGESTLGNLVAEVQRWATRSAGVGRGADRVHEPGRSAADMVGGTGTAAYPQTLTYKQAANVQPFANTLVNMDLTGAQIKDGARAAVAARAVRRARSCGWASRRASRTPTTRRRAVGLADHRDVARRHADRPRRRRTRSR